MSGLGWLIGAAGAAIGGFVSLSGAAISTAAFDLAKGGGSGSSTGRAPLPASLRSLPWSCTGTASRPDLVARSFAVIRELAGRRLGMRHFDVQLLGGWAMVRGKIVEMETGEGKTLTATLPAATRGARRHSGPHHNRERLSCFPTAAWMKPLS